MERRHSVSQPFLPGFAPAPDPARVARLDDPKTLIAIEQVVEFVVSCIDVLRLKKKARAPIDREDIAECRHEIALMLRAKRLPVPDDAWLDELVVELLGWWQSANSPPTSRRLRSTC